MKRVLMTILALSLVALIAVPAFAEVQNVKIDGSIVVKGFIRDNYATTGSGGGRALSGFADTNSRDWYNTVTKVGVEADLTDNASAKVVLINDRDWGGSTAISLSNSYITLKEMLYSPLTVKVGKMGVKIADGLVIGDGGITETTLGSDYGSSKSFDTIHGILDYDPLMLIVGTIKISENAQSTVDDIDGYLVDAIYRFGDDMNTVLDTYLVDAHYNSPKTSTGPSGASTKGVDVYVLAGTLNTNPIENLSAKLGLAYQAGDYSKTASESRNLKAYAFDLGATYALTNDYSPKIGAKYVYRSGQDNATTTGDYKGWLPLFEDQLNGVIYDPNTNTASICLNASVVPMDKLTVGLDFWMYNLAKKQSAASVSTSEKKSAGTELDLAAKYAYTEDISMGLNFAWFFPGNYYKSGYDDTAMQTMLELAVKF